MRLFGVARAAGAVVEHDGHRGGTWNPCLTAFPILTERSRSLQPADVRLFKEFLHLQRPGADRRILCRSFGLRIRLDCGRPAIATDMRPLSSPRRNALDARAMTVPLPALARLPAAHHHRGALSAGRPIDTLARPDRAGAAADLGHSIGVENRLAPPAPRQHAVARAEPDVVCLSWHHQTTPPTEPDKIALHAGARFAPSAGNRRHASCWWCAMLRRRQPRRWSRWRSKPGGLTFAHGHGSGSHLATGVSEPSRHRLLHVVRGWPVDDGGGGRAGSICRSALPGLSKQSKPRDLPLGGQRPRVPVSCGPPSEACVAEAGPPPPPLFRLCSARQDAGRRGRRLHRLRGGAHQDTVLTIWRAGLPVALRRRRNVGDAAGRSRQWARDPVAKVTVADSACRPSD